MRRLAFLLFLAASVLLCAAVATASRAAAAEELTGREIMERVDARDDGDNQTNEDRKSVV